MEVDDTGREPATGSIDDLNVLVNLDPAACRDLLDKAVPKQDIAALDHIWRGRRKGFSSARAEGKQRERYGPPVPVQIVALTRRYDGSLESALSFAGLIRIRGGSVPPTRR